jgi:hypothetical protein
MTRITDYKETASDFQKYFSNCYFLGKGKYDGYIIKTSNMITVNRSYCDPDEDEDAGGDDEVALVSYDSVSEDTPFVGMDANIISRETFKSTKSAIVKVEDLYFNKPFSGVVADRSAVMSVVYSNMHTYKKGIYKRDYTVGRLINPNPKDPVENSEELFLKALLQKEIPRPTKKEIEALLNCKIPAVQLSKRYVLVNEDYYAYPTLWYLYNRIGYIDNNCVIHTKHNGNVISGFKYAYAYSSRKARAARQV